MYTKLFFGTIYRRLDDRRTVTIRGTKKEAVEILKIYESKGLKADYPMKQLDADGLLWELNIKNHVQYVEQIMQDRIAGIRIDKRPILQFFFNKRLFKRIRLPVFLGILVFLTFHYSSAIKSSFTSVHKSLNEQVDNIKNSVVTTVEEESPVVMTFSVDGGATYISEATDSSKEFSVENDVISFEVGNEYTTIVKNGSKLDKATMIAKFDFKQNNIIR